MSDEKGPNPQSKKPLDNDFQQQRLKAWQPLLTPNYVLAVFGFIGVLFVILGIVILTASNSVKEQTSDAYETKCPRPTPGQAVTCTYNLDLTIEHDMEPPIYVYYKLTNFYQNHRRYVKSRSDAQLKGDDNYDSSACDPLEKYGDQNKVLYPCGLIAQSVFNDTFRPYNLDGSQIAWSEDGIAWPSDKNDKFNARAPKPSEETIGPSGQVINVKDEHFIVWMRTAALPTFKKLYGKIGQKLTEGQKIRFVVNDSFPVTGFGGEKRIVLSTTSWLGGKNDFLGWAYIAVAILCLLLALGFGIKHKLSPRPLGDMKYFNWPGAAGSRS